LQESLPGCVCASQENWRRESTASTSAATRSAIVSIFRNQKVSYSSQSSGRFWNVERWIVGSTLVTLSNAHLKNPTDPGDS
jgi:hypothetical protein